MSASKQWFSKGLLHVVLSHCLTPLKLDTRQDSPHISQSLQWQRMARKHEIRFISLRQQLKPQMMHFLWRAAMLLKSQWGLWVPQYAFAKIAHCRAGFPVKGQTSDCSSNQREQNKWFASWKNFWSEPSKYIVYRYTVYILVSNLQGAMHALCLAPGQIIFIYILHQMRVRSQLWHNVLDTHEKLDWVFPITQITNT